MTMTQVAAPASLSSPPKKRVSLEEFFRATMGQWAEWVDGEVIEMTPVSLNHMDLLFWLGALLQQWCQFQDFGRVCIEPFVMRLERSVRSPDVMVVRKEHLDRLTETHLEGPADLVVEIVSPESVRRDYEEKYHEYARAGVPEYWIVDPAHEVVTAFTLAEPGRYQVLFEGHEGRLESKVLPGFWMQVTWLWQRPLPPAHRVLREIGGEAYLRWLLAEETPTPGEGKAGKTTTDQPSTNR